MQIRASAWDSSLVNTGHDGATFTVYSNYRAGGRPATCDRGWQRADGRDSWGEKRQDTELAVRVADGEWGTGTYQAWTDAGWNGAADDMQAPGQALGLTWTSNGSGSLPFPGDLMIWSSSGKGNPGHVAVVSAAGAGTVTFVGQDQGYGMVTLPVSGSTVENDGWLASSSVLGWLSGPTWTGASEVPGSAALNAGGDAQLTSLSCPSTGNCAAGGRYTDSAGHAQAFIASETYGTWGSAALNTGADAQVNSLSCASAGNCSAGGYYTATSLYEQAFTATEANGTWGAAIQVPGTAGLNAGGNAQLSSVSCVAPGNCGAGGWYTDGSGHSQAFTVSQVNVSCPLSGPVWTSSSPEDSTTISPYTYNNNMFAPADGTATVTCVNAAGWGFETDAPNTRGSVQGYPEQILDEDGTPYSEYTKIEFEFSQSWLNLNSGDFVESAIDSWWNGNYSDPGASEVMVWTRNNGNYPAGSDTGTAVTNDGGTYELWYAAPTATRHAIFTFVDKTNSDSGTIYLLALIKYLVDSPAYGSVIGSDPAFESNDYGVEIQGTSDQDLAWTASGSYHIGQS